MNPEILAYPFLFVAVYFEAFLLVSFLSTAARQARGRGVVEAHNAPNVAVIVPCYNEEQTVGETVRSLLALNYPKEKLAIVLVDDGSADGTYGVLSAFTTDERVTIIRKENGGKHTALNAGIEVVRTAEFVGCLDADSIVAPDALRYIVPCFANPRVAAVTAAMSIHEPKTLIQHMQHAEYFFAIALRHVLSSMNGLYVTPGPFSLYRRSVFSHLGDFRHGHQTEDMEMALRIQQAGLLIENAPKARVYTKAPRTLPSLLRQRTRWISGFLRNITREYRGLIGSTRHGVLGVIVLPLALVSIISSILLFFLTLFMLVKQIVGVYAVSRGIPLGYVLTPHSFDLFYLPVSVMLILGTLIIVTALGLMLVGKRISETAGHLRIGLAAYALFYGIIAPFWLMRAVADVATGTYRAWR